MTTQRAIQLFLSQFKETDYTTAAPAINLEVQRAALDATSNAVAATIAAPGTGMIGRLLFVRCKVLGAGCSIAFTDFSGSRTVSLNAVDEVIALFGASATRWYVLSAPDMLAGITGNFEGLTVTVNSDAAATTDEDPSLVLKGGDAVAAPNDDIFRTTISQDSSTEIISIVPARSRNGAAFGAVALLLALGDASVTADTDATLRFRGGSGAAAVSADIRYDASVDAFVFENHTQLSFFGATPAARATAYTQTYSTADRTHAARTAVSLTDNGGGTADNTVASQAAPVTLTDSTGLSGSHDDTLAAVSGQDADYMYLPNILAATTSAKATQYDVNLGAGALAGIVQPDVPRNVIVNFTDANASISAFQLDFVGTAPDGTAVSEQFVFAGGLDQTGSKIFATITSITLTSVTGQGAGDTLDIGHGDKLGVVLPAGSTSLSIVKLKVDGTLEAAAATDTTNNSFTPTTLANGTRDYEVWYEFVNAQSTIINQNCSDLAQKIIELVTLATTARDNLKELTTQIAASKADSEDTAQLVNAIADDLQAYGLGQ